MFLEQSAVLLILLDPLSRGWTLNMFTTSICRWKITLWKITAVNVLYSAAQHCGFLLEGQHSSNLMSIEIYSSQIMTWQEVTSSPRLFHRIGRVSQCLVISRLKAAEYNSNEWWRRLNMSCSWNDGANPGRSNIIQILVEVFSGFSRSKYLQTQRYLEFRGCYLDVCGTR